MQFYKSFAEFVALHYALSIREDTKYWKDISEKSFSPALLKDTQLMEDDIQKMAMYKHIRHDMPIIGATYIAIGMNYFFYDEITQRYDQSGINMERMKMIRDKFNARKKYWEESCKEAQSLYEYLKLNYYS